MPHGVDLIAAVHVDRQASDTGANGADRHAGRHPRS
jgi:hypothetical protein